MSDCEDPNSRFFIAFAGAAIVIVFGSGSGALSVDNPWGGTLPCRAIHLGCVLTCYINENLEILIPLAQ